MKAIVLPEIGGPDRLRYQDLPDPAPGAGEALVSVGHAALNRRDLFITLGQYPGITLPAVLGSDGAGTVAAVGEGVTGVVPGDEVVVFPSLGWGPDRRLPAKGFTTLGVPDDGTWAQMVKVPAENLFPKPPHLSPVEAATMGLAGVTAYRAVVTRGGIAAGQTVVIPGVGGGVAGFAVQIAAALGARVFVTSGSDEKLEAARRLGAHGGVNHRNENWKRELKELAGPVDLGIDGVGGDVLAALVEIVRPGGRIVSFGATAGPQATVLLPRVFLKQLDLLGTSMGRAEEFDELLRLYGENSLHPALARGFGLAEAADALRLMERGEAMGKITLQIPQ